MLEVLIESKAIVCLKRDILFGLSQARRIEEWVMVSPFAA
jgi:hypothetical protein